MVHIIEFPSKQKSRGELQPQAHIQIEVAPGERVSPEVMNYVQARIKAMNILGYLSKHSISDRGQQDVLFEVRNYTEIELVGWILSASAVSVQVNPNFYRVCCLELARRRPED